MICRTCKGTGKIEYKAHADATRIGKVLATLDAKEWNGITEDQLALGWTDHKRMKLMQYFYQHRDIGDEEGYRRPRK